MIIRRTVLRGVFTALALVATACPTPPTGGGGPVWTAHHAGGPAAAGITPQASAMGTTAGWYVEFNGDNSGAPSTVSIYPRTGTNGDSLGTAQTFTAGAIGFGGGFLSDHILITGPTPTSAGALQFFAEAAGTWSAAGTLALASDQRVVALSDDTLVLLTGDGASAAVISVYDVAIVAGVVTPTLSTTFISPVAWGTAYRENFGLSTSLDGDVLAVASRDIATNGPGKVAIYRRTTGVWALETSLTGTANQFGRRVAIDDLGATERLAVGVLDSPAQGSVEMYSAAAGSWSLDTTINPPGVTDTFGGTEFGDSVALDGNLLVVGVHQEPIADTVGGDPRSIIYHSVFHLDSGVWTYETSLKALSSPLDPDDLNRGMLSVVVAGGHVVGTSLVDTPGCVFPCFSLRLEAWRFDRTPTP